MKPQAPPWSSIPPPPSLPLCTHILTHNEMTTSISLFFSLRLERRWSLWYPSSVFHDQHQHLIISHLTPELHLMYSEIDFIPQADKFAVTCHSLGKNESCSHCSTKLPVTSLWYESNTSIHPYAGDRKKKIFYSDQASTCETNGKLGLPACFALCRNVRPNGV